jgi:hypothetical protein
MIDYNAMLYDPVYAGIGVVATLNVAGDAEGVVVTVIDDTRPKSLPAGSAEVRGVGPGAYVRIPELTTNGITRDLWLDATLTFNGRSWTVRSYELRGSPNGEDLGEVHLFLKASVGPVVVAGAIPISFDDSMFTGMTELTDSVILNDGINLTRTSIVEQGGNYSILCHMNNAVTYCRVQSREAVRLEGGAVLIQHCYLEAEGIEAEEDHADVLQCYSPGARGAAMTVKNTHVRAFNTAATAGFFVADDWGGSLTFEDVIFQGGPYGLRVISDPGCHIDVAMKNVFFVSPWGVDGGPFSFEEIDTGTISITQWLNIHEATIVGGTLVPGNAIPQPVTRKARR